MTKLWTEEENKYIKENAASMSDEQMAISLSTLFNKNFTTGATRKQRQRLGIKKSGYRGFFNVVSDGGVT